MPFINFCHNLLQLEQHLTVAKRFSSNCLSFKDEYFCFTHKEKQLAWTTLFVLCTEHQERTKHFFLVPTPPATTPSNPNPSNAATTCSNSGEFRSPRGCFATEEIFNCDFYVSWQIDDNNNVVFTMKVINFIDFIANANPSKQTQSKAFLIMILIQECVSSFYSSNPADVPHNLGSTDFTA